jgi:hypothetical protein
LWIVSFIFHEISLTKYSPTLSGKSWQDSVGRTEFLRGFYKRRNFVLTFSKRISTARCAQVLNYRIVPQIGSIMLAKLWKF